MCVRFLGLLLVWVPGVLHAQSTSCSAPTLDGGFFAPKQETYLDGTKLSYTCRDGRKPVVSGWWAVSTCQNGQWSHDPQCIESISSCSEPPKIPHAVIIDQEYKEVFATGSEVQYECEDGFTVDSRNTRTSIRCVAGNWTEGPTCIPSITESTERETATPFASLDKCGRFPVVENAVITETERLYLRYACNDFYKLVGPHTVVCYRDGTWSNIPSCRVAFCSVDTSQYSDLKPDGVKLIKDGESMRLACVDKWKFENFSEFTCDNGRVESTRCCNRLQLQTGTC